ncbi:hypothetical protein ACVWY6_001581 [Williamsia sp. R60]
MSAPEIGEVETTASGIRFVRPLSDASAKNVPGKVDRWRAENPNHVHRQEVKTTGGAWVQFWGFRVYYGPCADCGGLVHTRRKIADKKDGRTNTGRWPRYCTECRRRRDEAHDADAPRRMAEKRKRQKADLLKQCQALGINPPQPGRPRGPAGSRL